jgi:hypothetical protein
MGALAARRCGPGGLPGGGSAGTLLLAVGLGSGDALAAGVCSTWSTAPWWPRRLVPAGRPHRGHAVAATGCSRRTPARLGAAGPAFFVAAVAVAGVPPLGGFLGKALLLQAAGGTPLAAVGGGGVLAAPAWPPGGAGARRHRRCSGRPRPPPRPPRRARAHHRRPTASDALDARSFCSPAVARLADAAGRQARPLHRRHRRPARSRHGTIARRCSARVPCPPPSTCGAKCANEGKAHDPHPPAMAPGACCPHPP